MEDVLADELFKFWTIIMLLDSIIFIPIYLFTYKLYKEIYKDDIEEAKLRISLLVIISIIIIMVIQISLTCYYGS